MCAHVDIIARCIQSRTVLRRNHAIRTNSRRHPCQNRRVREHGRVLDRPGRCERLREIDSSQGVPRTTDPRCAGTQNRAGASRVGVDCYGRRPGDRRRTVTVYQIDVAAIIGAAMALVALGLWVEHGGRRGR